MLKRMFGRTWPRDVSDPGPAVLANCPPPSLGYINDGIHSFHFFGGNSKPFLAFPSGSTVMLLAIVVPLCVAFPRVRIPLIVFTVFSLFCFVLTNTHFVADVIAGVYVGGVIGLIASGALPARISQCD
ncbi:membrane-associated phospholipid phosphatase [Xanthomonas campestris]|nr:membrane-associated phospholipid phosphatase [Xanthomonas sp. 3075]